MCCVICPWRHIVTKSFYSYADKRLVTWLITHHTFQSKRKHIVWIPLLIIQSDVLQEIPKWYFRIWSEVCQNCHAVGPDCRQRQERSRLVTSCHAWMDGESVEKHERSADRRKKTVVLCEENIVLGVMWCHYCYQVITSFLCSRGKRDFGLFWWTFGIGNVCRWKFWVKGWFLPRPHPLPFQLHSSSLP